MAPPPHSKPENVLKRAQELVGVGQAQAALSLLHEHVVSKRTRNSPIASLEPVMKLFVELCVDLRKGKLAKDGLYQYKNTAQNTNVGTIETVFKHFISLAEDKVTEAQAKSDAVQSTSSTSNIDDLEASETPESILLSTVSGEQSKDRTDRAIVTPWLKFLWETYRTVLDIFKNNARLEIMYQSTAHQAFQFCSKYARKTEFRRLCELLRNHLTNASKFSAQMHAINLSDPDTLQRHLDTRFQQLNVAVELELWQEAFRSIEDIYNLISLSKRPPKNIMMANYYQNLTRIFLVSDNHLFHAAAWSRYYNLMRQSAAAVASGQSPKKDNPAVTEADMTKAASFVLLSALSIPVISTSRSRGALVDVDETRKNKNVRLTNLLGMNTAPTRAILFKDALSKGLLKRARPEIRELYNILEVDFHPLSICKRISPILTQIGEDPEMQKYVLPLQQVILTRLFQQLSQVYDSVQVEFVLGLAQFPEPFQVSKSTIEKFIMNGCKKGDLAIRVDHAAGVLTFDSDVFSSAKALHPGSGAGSADDAGSVQRLQSTPAEIVRSQLTRLAKALYTTCQYVDPSFNAARHAAKEDALARAKAGADKEREETLARRSIIEKKKQAASSAQAKKDKEEQTKKLLRAQQAQEEEQRRLREEQKERETKRIQAEQQRIQREEIEKQVKELKKDTKINIDLPEDLSELDSTRIRVLKLQALEKEKNQLGDQLRITGKRIDHLERAYRREEIKHLSKDYDAQMAADKKAYDEAADLENKEALEKHTEAVELKNRLGRLTGHYNQFVKDVRENRKAQFEKQKKSAEKELQSKMQQRVREVKERRAREKREAEEQARQEREEEERLEREAEEKARAEEEKRARLAEDKRKRDEERRELDEKAAKQRAREEEAEAKLAAKKAGGSRFGVGAPQRTFDRPVEGRTDAPSGPPRVFGDKKPSWREREEAKRAAQAAGGESAESVERTESPAPPAADEAPKRGGYVPPALRAAGGAAGGWREREGSGRGFGAHGGRDTGRTESPAAGGSSGRYEAPRRGFGAREDRGSAGREERSDRGGREERSERPPPADGASAGGKYRPGMFRQRQQGGQ